MNCWSHRPRSSRPSTPLISLYSFVDGLACLFLRSDPRLNLCLGKGSHLDPPNIYTMVTPLVLKRTALLEFIPLIDESISIGTVEHKADIKDEKLLFTCMHLADTFIQSDLQCIQVIHLLSVCVFPGNRTHNLCTANAMLYH